MIARVVALALLSCSSAACNAPASRASSGQGSTEADRARTAQPAVQSPAGSLPRDAAPDAQGWGSAGGLRYLEIVRGGASADETLPLLLVIHGLGDKPSLRWLEAVDVEPAIKARMILPQAPTPHGDGFAWFPYRAGSNDAAALARGISEAAEQLARMITVLQTQRPTRGRAVVSGFSQGGMLSFALALGHPALVEYALPISGLLPGPLWPLSAPEDGWAPPIRALHGSSDTVVRYNADEQLVAHLIKLGYPAELVPFRGVEHAITPAMSALARSSLSSVLGRLDR